MIKPLTSLRFVFAFMVFVSHLSFLKFSDSLILRNLYNHLFFEGYIGVTFFFILSGFILAYSYEQRFKEKTVTLKRFYIARIARIYPLHVITLLVSLFYVAQSFLFADLIKWIGKFGINLFLLQSYFINKNIHFSFNAPSWSISDELFFYLLFPLVLKFSNHFTLKKQLALFVLIGSIFILLIPQVALEYQHALFYISPLFRFIDFYLGMIAFSVFKGLKQKSLAMKWWTLIEMSGIVLLGLFIFFHQKVAIVYRYGCYYWLPMVVIILIFAFQKGHLSKMLSNKIFLLLGEISYAFYLIHQLVLKYMTSYVSVVGDIQIGLLALFLSLVLSYLLHVYFEKPINYKIKALFKS